MSIEQLALLVKKYIEVSKKTDSKPGISYIADRSLNIQGLRTLIEKELKGTNDYLRLFFMVFFLFEGDSMEVAKFKAFNDLYYLILQEVGDKEYLENECDDCNGSGRVDCDECYGEGEIECYVCDGSGELEGVEGPEDCDGCNGSGNDYCGYCDSEGEIECDECDGSGELEGMEGPEDCDDCNGSGNDYCGYCDGGGNIECNECEGSGTVNSEEEYVFLNNEYWVFYSDEVSDELEKAENESDYGLFDAYEILDKSKGGVYLLKTESESEQLTLDEFENTFGPYYDVQGMYRLHSEYNLKDFNLSNSYGIIKWTNSYVIR